MESGNKKKHIRKTYILFAVFVFTVVAATGALSVLANRNKEKTDTNRKKGTEDTREMKQEENKSTEYQGERLEWSGDKKDLVSLAGIVREEIEIKAEEPINVSEDFTEGAADFSIELFKQCVSEEEGNVMLSPLSAWIVLSMTANGADGETLSQMEKVLGGNLKIGEINDNIKEYTGRLSHDASSMIKFADSVWIKAEGKMKVLDEFLRVAANDFYADVYSVPFDESTVEDINTWVSDNTDGMIEKLVSGFNDNTELFLVNTVLFDGKWAQKYEKSADGKFTTYSGETKDIEVMKSTEDYYLHDNLATGFCKPYTTGYSFVAILPNEDVDVMDYISSLSGEHFIEMLENSFGNSDAEVRCTLPKFTMEGTYQLGDALKNMGMELAFDRNEADFSHMAEAKGNDSSINLSIGNVIQKTYISVDENGTKAAAATGVEMITNDAVSMVYEVKIDRPFVYAIVDNQKKLPIFIGVMLDFE